MNILIPPALPDMGLSKPSIDLAPIAQDEPRESIDEPAISLVRPRLPNIAESERAKRFGFYVDWDENSFASLKRHARDLDVLFPMWLHLGGSDIESIESDDPIKQGLVRDWLAQNVPSLEVIPTIDNFDGAKQRWRGEELTELLATPEARNRLANRLSSYTADQNFQGLLIDFEAIPADQQPNFAEMIGLLGHSLHDRGKKLLVLIPGGDDAYDVSRLAQEADAIVLANYDEHAGLGAGPLAAEGWFEAQLDRVSKLADPRKIVVGIGSYAYDWAQGGGISSLSVADAWDLLAQSKASLSFDPISLNPNFSYQDSRTGERHQSWFLDSATVFNQTAAALAISPAGLALWRLGTEDESVWNFFARGHAPNEAVQGLSRLDPGPSIGSRGAGEIMRSTGVAEEPGTRRLIYDRQTNLVRGESISVAPKRLTVSRWGGQKKAIALTFDDGPSAEYTPAILDLLKRENVHATFFVTGLSATLHPDLLRREFAEGHDIGNHTFTHPDLTAVSKWQLSLELTATQRVIESELGIRTPLFRQPYGSDEETIAASDATSIKNASELGYVTVGMRINPKDWTMPGAKSIVDRVVAQAENGNGNVVLLHDAGGDRSETVAALPQIIAALRARGYSFVTVHELLGLPRSAVMSDLPSSFATSAFIDHIGFSLIRIFSGFLSLLILVVISLAAVRLLFVATAAVLQAKAAHGRDDIRWCPRSFSVIIPAYNEATVIVKSISALLSSPLKNFRIFVVDDGSTDGTAAVARAAFAGNDRVRVLQKVNEGKSAALNCGLRRTRADVIVTLDADTIFESDALGWLVRHFKDPRVGAVAGAALVGNAINSITRFQSLEYVTSQNLDRRAMELANGIQVVPGAIGAWRRGALRQVGGFTPDTLAEDADATVRLERSKWRVLYEPRAMAYTEAPETVQTFIKQRFRWMLGMLQTAFKHRDTYLHSGSMGVKLCTLPNILIFQFLFALISPVMDLMLVWGVFGWIWFFKMHPGVGAPAELWRFVGYWGGFQMLELSAAALAFKLDAKTGWWWLLPLVVVQRFCYRQLLYWVAIQSSGAAIKGKFVGWGKLQRTGKVLLSQLRPPRGLSELPC